MFRDFQELVELEKVSFDVHTCQHGLLLFIFRLLTSLESFVGLLYSVKLKEESEFDFCVEKVPLVQNDGVSVGVSCPGQWD